MDIYNYEENYCAEKIQELLEKIPEGPVRFEHAAKLSGLSRREAVQVFSFLVSTGKLSRKWARGGACIQVMPTN